MPKLLPKQYCNLYSICVIFRVWAAGKQMSSRCLQTQTDFVFVYLGFLFWIGGCIVLFYSCLHLFIYLISSHNAALPNLEHGIPASGSQVLDLQVYTTPSLLPSHLLTFCCCCETGSPASQAGLRTC